MSEETAEQSQKVVLHMGCGPVRAEKLHQTFRGPDWREVRHDINPDVSPDIAASITDMAAVETGSVGAVWWARRGLGRS